VPPYIPAQYNSSVSFLTDNKTNVLPVLRVSLAALKQLL